jgi:hypothetical protein
MRRAVVSGIPTCDRALIGKPCPGLRARVCTDLGPDFEPRCLSRCERDADCESYDKCVAAGRDQTGPKRCVPRDVDPKKCGGG